MSGNLQGRNSINIMRIKSFLSALTVCSGLFMFSCDEYDDTMLREQLENHEQRLAALEEWQERTNNNISAVQQLLSTQDYITKVTPVTLNGETTGYTIEFAQSAPITIYNGTKGDTGDTPQIGIVKDGDNWYWTLNGEPIKDESEDIVYAKGDKGDEGDKAPVPQISLGSAISSGTIETDNGSKDENAWYLSVDNGEKWYRISGEQGETGPKGDKGDQGDAWFAKAPELSDDGMYYTFTLADGVTTFQVPVYQGIILTFTNVPDLSQTVEVPGTADITYSVGGNIENPVITALVKGEGWEATQTEGIISIKAGSDKNANLVIIATDNESTSVTYTLKLERKDTDISGNTYTVYTAEGLLEWNDAMEANHSTNCVLSADIDFTGKVLATANTTFYSPFTGTFNGNGHTIYNLSVKNEDASGLGLIGYGSNCTVKDLTLVNPTITKDETGDIGIIGYMNNSSIVINCHVVGGRITTSGYTGGIVGSMRYPAMVIACSSSAELTGEYTGGIVGYNSDLGSVFACYATGSVTSVSTEQPQFTNAIAGRTNGIISACYWDVEGAEFGWANNYSTPGTEGAEKVDGTTVTWEKAMEQMNAYLETFDYPDQAAPYKGMYKYVPNEGEDKDTRPLLVVKTTE